MVSTGSLQDAGVNFRMLPRPLAAWVPLSGAITYSPRKDGAVAGSETGREFECSANRCPDPSFDASSAYTGTAAVELPFFWLQHLGILVLFENTFEVSAALNGEDRRPLPVGPFKLERLLRSGANS